MAAGEVPKPGGNMCYGVGLVDGGCGGMFHGCETCVNRMIFPARLKLGFLPECGTKDTHLTRRSQRSQSLRAQGYPRRRTRGLVSLRLKSSGRCARCFRCSGALLESVSALVVGSGQEETFIRQGWTPPSTRKVHG